MKVKMRVKIDNIFANIQFGYFGTHSERILIDFEETHPVYGDRFMTKYYTVSKDNIITWGHDNKKIRYEVSE